MGLNWWDGGKDKLEDWDWYIHINIYKIDNKELLYSTGNSTQYSIMAYMGKNLKKSVYTV